MKHADCPSLRVHSGKSRRRLWEAGRYPPRYCGGGITGKGPEWGPLKNEFLNGGPSGWGAGLAERRGCVCDILGAPSNSHEDFQEWQVTCWLLLPAFSPLWSRLDSLASQKYVTHNICLPTQFSHELFEKYKETVVPLVPGTSLISFQLLCKVFQ